MTLPSDWPARWWLRQGDVAAVLKLPGRPSADMIFAGDDLNLWEFRIDGQAKPFIWNHEAHGVALEPEDDPALSKALLDIMAKLAGRPWG
jgi:hypothetical protein